MTTAKTEVFIGLCEGVGVGGGGGVYWGDFSWWGTMSNFSAGGGPHLLPHPPSRENPVQYPIVSVELVGKS